MSSDTTPAVTASSTPLTHPPPPPRPRVRVCILAAGYGSRLERDIKEDAQQRFKHLIGIPKPLLPINSIPLLTRWLHILLSANFALCDILIVGNSYNYEMLRVWAEQNNFPVENIINDGTTSNEGRLGAVKDMELVVRRIEEEDKKNQQDSTATAAASALSSSTTAAASSSASFSASLSSQSILASSSSSSFSYIGLLVIGGDTLFFPSFSLSTLLAQFHLPNQHPQPSQPHISLLLHYTVSDPSKYGILEVDQTTQRVTSFLEKPTAEQTQSRAACPCFYLLARDAATTIHEYTANATTLQQVDAPGQFIRALVTSQKHPIKSVRIDGRFDIGGLDTYIECDEWFRKEEQKE